ncbi:MAG: helix-turn-helix domain-containing protein [Pseudomonadota bacterium]
MDTRTALLDHAETLARTRGLDAFSFGDLAERQGIKKASVHYHFATKPQLALALIKRYVDAFFVRLPKAGTAAQRMEAFLAHYRATLGAGEQTCLCVAFAAGRHSLSAPVVAELNRFHTEATYWLQEVMAQGRRDKTLPAQPDTLAEAAAALALVEGAQLIARAAGDPTLFDTATAQLRARLDLPAR